MIATCPVTGGVAVGAAPPEPPATCSAAKERASRRRRAPSRFAYGSNTYDTDLSAAMVCACSYDGGVDVVLVQAEQRVGPAVRHERHASPLRRRHRRLRGADHGADERAGATGARTGVGARARAGADDEAGAGADHGADAGHGLRGRHDAVQLLREEVQHQPEVRQGQVQVLREELRQGVQGARDFRACEESEEGQQGGEAQQMQTEPGSNAMQKCAKNKISKKCAATCRAALDLPACSCTRKKCALPSA